MITAALRSIVVGCALIALAAFPTGCAVDDDADPSDPVADAAAQARVAGDSTGGRSDDGQAAAAAAATTTNSAPSDELDAAIDGVVASGESPPPHEVHGRLSASYRGRSHGSANDEDLYGYLSLDVARAKKRDLSLHFFGRASLDLDDGSDAGGSIFNSLNDRDRDSLDGHVYEAYLDLEGDLAPDALGIRRLRIGRQRMHAGISILMDGGRVDFERVREFGNLHVAVFGGVPAYLYDSSRSGDWTAGLDLDIEPFDGTRLEFRYVHIDDRNPWIGGERSDEYTSFSWRQRVIDELRFDVDWSLVGLDTRDIRVRVLADIPDADLSISAAWFRQDDVTLEYTTLLDPYVGVLGTSFAFDQGDLQITKILGDHFAADVGATVRVLDESARESAFNRDFVRLWASLSSHRWPVEELGLSATVEWWEGGGDETLSAGGELDWRPCGDVRVGAGSYYSLFKSDLFVVAERVDVTTLFTRLRWRAVDDLELDLRYEYEIGDDGRFHTFIAGFTWRF